MPFCFNYFWCNTLSNNWFDCFLLSGFKSVVCRFLGFLDSLGCLKVVLRKAGLLLVCLSLLSKGLFHPRKTFLHVHKAQRLKITVGVKMLWGCFPREKLLMKPPVSVFGYYFQFVRPCHSWLNLSWWRAGVRTSTLFPFLLLPFQAGNLPSHHFCVYFRWTAWSSSLKCQNT